jgi:hypothetical protein
MREPLNITQMSMNLFAPWNFKVVSHVHHKYPFSYAPMAVNIFGLAFISCCDNSTTPATWCPGSTFIEDAEIALGTHLFRQFCTYMNNNSVLTIDATLSNKCTYCFSITLGADRLHFTPLHDTYQEAQTMRFAHFPAMEKAFRLTTVNRYSNAVRSIFSPLDHVYCMFEVLAASKYNKMFQDYMTTMFPTCQKIELIFEYSFGDIICTSDQGKLRMQEMGNDFRQAFLILTTIFYDKVKFEHKNFSFVYTLADDKFVFNRTLKEACNKLKVQVIHDSKAKNKKRTRRARRSVPEIKA